MRVKQTAKIVVAWELFEQHVPKGHIARKLGVHRETIRICLTDFMEKL